MQIWKKTTFFRQRQQKSIFGQVFKQKFSDQKSTQNVYKHIILHFYVYIGFLKAFDGMCIQPLIISFFSYNFAKIAKLVKPTILTPGGDPSVRC